MARPRRLLALVVSLALVAGACGSDDEPGGSASECETPEVRSVAREWNEALLRAIRLDVPSPTVHARNLFHTSAAMWDAWAAYDDEATAVYVDEAHDADDIEAARTRAISHAAYRVLESRYLLSPGAEESITGFEDLLRALCLDPADTSTEGDDPVAVGNRVGTGVLAATVDDRSLEADGYVDPTYQPVNDPLVVDEPGTVMNDPNRWQPLDIEGMVTQTGMPLDTTVQEFVGPHWGAVATFAIEPGTIEAPPLDPGPPPQLGDAEGDAGFKDGALTVLRHGATLDPADGETIDISPGALGDAAPGQYGGSGRAENPITGEPYEPNQVLAGDYGRVIAEFWADGPTSETPPGHWNVVANEVVDDLPELRLGGDGPELDPLEYDVKLYLALNGAVHDAAVAAWGAKRRYDYARPISMIRHMGGLGQSSDPEGPAYHPDGLPLEDGLVEVVTAESSTPGGRHEALADHVGEVAVLTWQGTPDDPETEVGGVGWLRAVEWVPYQLSTFVTPAFAGYVSGHSTFSRAAAEVLTAATGSPYFPGGLGEWTVPAGSLEFEAGPTTDVTLQWASYVDAADQAGHSRLFGGIHPPADDFPGREIGAQVGRAAWAHAMSFW